MDMETVLPKTCQICHGTGVLYYGDDQEYDVEPCECKVEKRENNA
jgi:hypothetical protein